MIDFQTVKSAAAGRWEAILPSLGVPAEAITGKHTECPGCGGKDRFRYLKDNDGGFICGQGGDATGGDGFDLLVHGLGYSKSESLRAVADFLGVTEYASADDKARVRETVRIQQTAKAEDVLLRHLTVMTFALSPRVTGRALLGNVNYMKVNPQYIGYTKPTPEDIKREADSARVLISVLQAQYTNTGE